MARKQFNARLPELTIKQISELVKSLPAESQSHVIILAVDRLYNDKLAAIEAAKENKMETTTIVKDGKEYNFAFDPQNDDPVEGVTLTGVFENGNRVRPSSIPYSEIPYEEAERQLIK